MPAVWQVVWVPYNIQKQICYIQMYLFALCWSGYPLACFEAVPSFIKNTTLVHVQNYMLLPHIQLCHSEGRSSGGKNSCLRMCKVNYFHCYTMTHHTC